MATTQASPDVPKSSFAKIAASADTTYGTTTTNDKMSSKNQHPAGAKFHTLSDPVVAVGASVVPNSVNKPQAATSSPHFRGAAPGTVDETSSALKNIRLDSPVPNLVVCGSSRAALDKSRAPASGSDESQRADSCSELDTKPPSLDGKSITSGTTFALDEKESLRPDDSASVQAAAEDDDASSLVAGSEAAARARAAQTGDVADRRQPPVVVGSQVPGILTPQSISSEQQQENGGLPLRSDAGSSDALNVIYRSAPDEKLLDALATPRDRFFLLRLEKDVIDFVQNSKEPYMDLPPSNSFCRMLTHKLADYYHMTHSYEPHIGSVRIFRTPFCRVPPSLAQMVPQPSTSANSTPPPAVLPRKIMRRGQEGDSGLVSGSPSKPGSEAGSDSKDKPPPANQKLTREQREEMYKLARERIFGSSEENTTADTETDNGMSRTSSMSANRSNLGKRAKPGKQRRDSDSFDTRHQYTPYWGPQQQTWVPQPQMQYMPPPGAPYGSPGQASYPTPVAPAYGQQAPYPAIPNMVPASPYAQYPPSQYVPQAPQQQYPAAASPMPAYPSQMPSGTPPQSWQGSYSPSSAYAARGPTQGGVPYAFGQLPANANPNDPKSQHPIPGSYNRNHGFNPKTQSFIPGGSMPPAHPPQPPFTAPGSHHSSPQIGTPHLAYTGYQSPMPPPSYGSGYSMARQGSNTSLPAFHGPQQHPPPHPFPGAPMQGPPPHPPAPSNSRPHGQHGQSNQTYGHLPAYGNPASLPQKPATGI